MTSNFSTTSSNLKATRSRAKQPSKKWISTSMLLAMLLVVSSALVLYFIQRRDGISSLHLSVGLLLCILFGFHLWRHKSVLIHYVSPENLWLPALLNVLCFIGVYLALPPFNRLLDWSDSSRQAISASIPTNQANEYELIESFTGHEGQAVRLAVTTNKGYVPNNYSMVVWAETIDGQFLQTLFSTELLSHLSEDGKQELMRRPEATPHWRFQRAFTLGVNPNSAVSLSSEVDGLTGATPKGSFVLETTLVDAPKTFVIKMETNRGNDWNDYYHANAFPDDVYYSGSGRVGQPSVIYQAVVDPTQPIHLMQLAGHGHHNGDTGEIYSDTSRLSTALTDFHRMIVQIQ